MRRIRATGASVVALVVVAGALVAPGGAGAAGWQRISRDGLANTAEATSALAGSSVVVAWTSTASTGLATDEATTFTSSPTDSVQEPVTVPVVTGWATLNSDPELITAPDGGIVLAYAGSRTSAPADPLSGILVSGRSDTGSWGAPQVVVPAQGASHGLAGLILPDGSTLLTGDCCGTAAFVFHGGIGVGDASDGHTVANRAMAQDAAGNVWIAWYDLDRGVVLRQLDATTGAPLGVPAIAPLSGSVINGGSRVALVCNPVAAGCRVVYRATDQRRILSWAAGEVAPTVVTTIAPTSMLGAFHAAYRSDGRLWVAWAVRPATGAPLAQFTLGGPRGSGGQVYPVPLQRLQMPYHLHLQPVGDKILLVGTFSSTVGAAQWADLVGIPAAVPDSNGPTGVLLQRAPGASGVQALVRFRAPAACAAGCSARAELRSRTGTCPTACLATGGTSLPGDGPVVLGRRGTFSVPGTARMQFTVPVSAAALLRTRWRTLGDFRGASTRLRIWLTTRTGSLLVVRDGVAIVSIADVRSGALPGLAGIL